MSCLNCLKSQMWGWGCYNIVKKRIKYIYIFKFLVRIFPGDAL